MREPARTFCDLTVWQKAHQLALSVYRLTEGFPEQERYGLTSQLRRSAVSVPANIVEGFKRRGRAKKRRYLNIAQGSLEESRYYLILAKDLGYADSSELLALFEEGSKLLGAYTKAIQSSES